MGRHSSQVKVDKKKTELMSTAGLKKKKTITSLQHVESEL